MIFFYLGIKTKRPDDYFAQMLKSDDHMQKIRKNLVAQQEIMERREKVRKQRELKKYGKQIQIEVLKKRQKEKKEILDQVKKYKKGQQSNLDFLNDKANANRKGKASKKVTKKRAYKNDRYGFGGQKKRSKYNTADSAAQMGKFNHKQNSAPRRGRSKGGKAPVVKNRPGKLKRQQAKKSKG